jgi:hypothetical protein
MSIVDKEALFLFICCCVCCLVGFVLGLWVAEGNREYKEDREKDLWKPSNRR